MDARRLTKLRTDLTSFLDDVVGTLGHPRRRHSCDAYLRGVLLDGHRKSVEPMAARLKTIEQGAEDYEQALQQFLNQSPWDEQDLLDGLHAWIGRRLGGEGHLVIDDTGFPKQGGHSVGVARQYTGTLGKVASCQVAVTLQFATAAHVVALDARLYLPEAWTEDRDRLTKAGVPDAVGYQPKWQMALARDAEGEPPTAHERLLPLAWLVGDWVDDGGSVVVASTCRWKWPNTPKGSVLSRSLYSMKFATATKKFRST